MLCVLHLCLTGWVDWSSLGERGLAFPALGMVMEGTKLGRRMRGGWRLLLPLRGDGQRTRALGTLPSLCCSIPFHHGTNWVLMLAGEVGTPAVVASGNPLPLATSSCALVTIFLCPSKPSLVL